MISLWCAVPFYEEGRNPKAVYALLSKLTVLLKLKMELEDLKREADSFSARMSAELDREMRRFTADLEKRPSFLI